MSNLTLSFYKMEDHNSAAANPVPGPNEEPNSNSSSLTLSITPPLSDPPKDDSSTISEHLSSIENDRSMQEIEVTSLPGHFSLLLQNLPSDDERISQEPKPPSVNSSFNSTSIISLNGLEKFVSTNMEGRNNAQSILEEILNNEQFKSDTESKEESLDIFANVDLDDKLLNSYNGEKSANFTLGDSLKNDSVNSNDEVYKRVRDFEELIAIKDTTIAALTSELDSFRELISNTSTNSLGTSTTEYKQFQEECHSKLVEYHNAIVHKDEQIEKLTNSLQQSILNREEMKQHFKNEVGQLQEQLEKTSNLLKEHKCLQKTEFDFDETCSKFETVLDSAQVPLFSKVKMAFNNHVEHKRNELENEISKLKSQFDSAKQEQDAEISHLRELLENVKPFSSDVLELKQELDTKHSKEMEELRTYFEKKCADLEKNYSEEVFSQQSRKMSGSSSCSDTELSSDFVFNQPGPGGDNKIEYTKKDVTKMKQTLAQVVSLLDNFNLDELTDDEFDHLKTEISKFELRSLIKYDLALMKNELQNKYHAELEILREDFDNRVDVLNVEHENKLTSLEKKYLEEIDDLNTQLRGRISTTTQQEVANSGEFEIDEVVQSYERRLQEQVTLAKIDIIAALESQIQRLVASDSIDDDWPEELLQLKARFAEKYQQEILRLGEAHLEEIARLKEEHVKTLNGALERARRRSLRDADSLSKGEIELLKERDALKKQTLSLRNLLGELLKYFTQCEDELNNTLVEELVTKNFTQIENELEITSPRDSLSNIKRVHITPNFNDLITLIDNSADNDLESIDLKSELGSCLQKLKSDANAILALSTAFNKETEKIDVPKTKSGSLEKEMTSLTRKLINETQIKNELAEQLSEAKSIVQSLETDRGALENQLELLLESQKVLENDLLHAREKIAELIENGHKEIVSEGYGENGERAVRGLAEAVASLAVLQEKVRSLSESPRGLDTNTMHLIEDLARVGDKIVEEARRERDDYKQQVEHLEQQLREMSKLTDAAERRCKEVEDEHKEAVDKIYELRDIIRDLEDQVKTKTTAEEELRNIVDELELIVKHQNNDEETRPTEPSRDVSDVEKLHQYVGSLESEVQKLRLSSEIAGSEGALQQIKNHLCEFETTLDKRTKELEGLHSAVSTSCSSPSEDMSIRDVVHQDRSVYDECEVPLQQLARLKEKLMRHSRAEDAAVKRIRDLELQLLALKRDLEDSQNEREILRKQTSDHLVLISNLQIRLDEQRIRAEHIEKQTNTSLEVQNYDLKNTIASLEEKISKRDKTISQLKTSIEETKKRLEDRENELAANKEDDMVVQMQEQLELLRSENLKLKSKIDKEAQMLPNLVENIISDKNSDIEKLREKLEETERQLELFSSLNLDKKEIESLDKLRLSGISFHDIIDLENLEHGRKEKISSESLQLSPIVPLKRNDKTAFLESQPEISTIEKVASSNLFYSLQVPQAKANSTAKHVRFEDEVEATKVVDLQNVIAEKDQLIQDYKARLEKLQDLQANVEQLQITLEETEASLKKATETFHEEQKENEERMKDIRLELASQRCKLTEREEELRACQAELEDEKSRALEREKELKSLQKLKSELKTTLKVKESELKSHEETLKLQNEELKKLQDDVASLKIRNDGVDKTVKQKDAEVAKLKKQNEDVSKELNHVQHLLAEKDKIIDQMEVDSKSLHVNLETIQNKLQETGNVVDLGRRLREEQKRNSTLYDELHELKAQLLGIEKKSIEDITDQVQRELNYSAYLDSTLINAVSDGSMESEDLEALRLSLKKQKSVNKQLVKNKELVEKRCDELEHKYENVKKELDKVQYEDAMLIGELRTKLEQALQNEVEFDRILRSQKSDRVELQSQLKSMKQKVSMLNSKTNSLPEIDHEYRGLSKIISTLEDENSDLRLQVGRLQDTTRVEITTKLEDITKLESKLSEVTYSEQILKDRLDRTKAELELKTNEAARNKKLMEDMQLEHKKLIKQLEQKLKSPDSVSDQLMAKIHELNDIVKNDRLMMGVIERLRYENGVLEDRIAILEDRKTNNLPFDDPVSRANFLFAKYLRSESYRKALAWQKRYLISLLETYQNEPLHRIPGSENLDRKRAKRRPVQNRFKCVAVMVVSVCRMKYLVRRWHSGKRISEQRIAQNQQVQFQVGQPVSSQNFTSNVNKSTKSALNQPKTDMPWFGSSPPSKEPSALRVFSSQPKASSTKISQDVAKVDLLGKKKLEPSGYQRRQEVGRPGGSTNRVLGDSALTSPGMLSKYIERFNQIQDRLGLDTFK
ncbi:pericentrin isoform X3 [Zophobas morio]|uniref:pericentrin isoform X3 n=1 Tax=Zophobas morio TaxID=2755281 RepID=UPI003082F20C